MEQGVENSWSAKIYFCDFKNRKNKFFHFDCLGRVRSVRVYPGRFFSAGMKPAATRLVMVLF